MRHVLSGPVRGDFLGLAQLARLRHAVADVLQLDERRHLDRLAPGGREQFNSISGGDQVNFACFHAHTWMKHAGVDAVLCRQARQQQQRPQAVARVLIHVWANASGRSCPFWYMFLGAFGKVRVFSAFDASYSREVFALGVGEHQFHRGQHTLLGRCDRDLGGAVPLSAAQHRRRFLCQLRARSTVRDPWRAGPPPSLLAG